MNSSMSKPCSRCGSTPAAIVGAVGQADKSGPSSGVTSPSSEKELTLESRRNGTSEGISSASLAPNESLCLNLLGNATVGGGFDLSITFSTKEDPSPA